MTKNREFEEYIEVDGEYFYIDDKKEFKKYCDKIYTMVLNGVKPKTYTMKILRSPTYIGAFQVEPADYIIVDLLNDKYSLYALLSKDV